MANQSANPSIEMSALRCVRRVVPERNDALALNLDPISLLSRVAVISSTVFGTRRWDLVQLPRSNELPIEAYPTAAPSEVQNADIFQAQSLQLELFARKAESSDQVDLAVHKAFKRVTERNIRRNSRQTQTGKTEGVFVPNPLRADLDAIESRAMENGFDGRFVVHRMVDLAKQGKGRGVPGNFYAFEIDEATLGGKMLLEQAAYLDESLRKINACKALFKTAFPQEFTNPLQVPFMFVRDSIKGDRALFEDRIDDELRAGVEFTLQSPRWKSAIGG